MVTISDVARRAGVSTATVSHVLNGTRFVSPATRQRVLAAIEELRYQPSAVARGLATNKTYTVGMVVADITNPFFAQLVRGVEDRLAPAGYGLFICNTDERPEREADYLDLLLRKRVDGLVVAPTGALQPRYGDFVRRGTPVVYVDRRLPEAVGPFVGIDNVAAGYLATEHLLRLGHRRIGFLARHPSLYTVSGRIGGYRRALADFGVAVDEGLICTVSPYQERAVEGAHRLLTMEPRPTAVITGNHIMTLGLLQAVQERGLRIPEDLSVVCFDDHAWSPLFSPPLTVIAHPMEELVQAVVATLLGAIAARGQREGEGAASPPTPSDVLLPARLVVRGSSCPPRAPTPPLAPG